LARSMPLATKVMSSQFISDGTGGAARASRDKIIRSSPRADRMNFVSGRGLFSVSALTGLRYRYGPSRPKPFGETPKSPRPAPAKCRALRPASSWLPSNGVCSARDCARNSFFSLLPAGLSARASRNAPGAARIAGAHNAGREAACIVRARARQRSARGMLQIRIAWRLILRFTFGRQRRGPYAERRTSCVLYDRASCRMPAPPTRLPGSFAPVEPDQRGSKPPCWIPPGAARRGAIA
jgi:hypothetical protein